MPVDAPPSFSPLSARNTPEGVLVRFVRGGDGRVRALTVSIERVRDLRFDRM